MTDSTNGNVTLGTAPDSWGIWFPDHPQQTPWTRFLDEVQAAGYEWIELGPYGYLPTEADLLSTELLKRGLKLSAGTIGSSTHLGKGQWDVDLANAIDTAKLSAAMGAKHLVVLPAMWSHPVSGEILEDRKLTVQQRNDLHRGQEFLGKRIYEEFGLMTQFHPHADSHVEFESEIRHFIEDTDSSFVNLCLDTGHAEYGGASSVNLIHDFPERIGYLHLKQVNPAIMARVRSESQLFAQANLDRVMVEPPMGLPDLNEVIQASKANGLNLFGIVEQDMFPVRNFDEPFPIAERTFKYLKACI